MYKIYPKKGKKCTTTCMMQYGHCYASQIHFLSKLYIWPAAKSPQSCPTLRDPRDSSPPGSPIPGTLQARALEWVAISFSNAWKWKVKVKSLSCVRPSATPWTAAHKAPPSMGFARQEYWSGVPLPSPIYMAYSPIIGNRSWFLSLFHNVFSLSNYKLSSIICFSDITYFLSAFFRSF